MNSSIQNLKRDLIELHRAFRNEVDPTKEISDVYREKIKEVEFKISQLIAQKMNNMNLTHMERQVLEALIDGLYAEEGFSDIDILELVDNTNIPSKSLRGVLSSLVQKGIIHISEAYNDTPPLVYLCNSHYDLHPRWIDYSR